MQSAFSATVPRQHGAWTVLLCCFIIGAAAGAKFNIPAALLLIAVLAAFMGRHSISAYLRPPPESRDAALAAWGAAYLAVFLLAGAALVLRFNLRFLYFPAAAAAAITAFTLHPRQRNREMTIPWHIAGILGLTLVAPAAEYCARGAYSLKTLEVWLLCALFFTGSIFHVRYLARLRANPPALFGERLAAGRASLAFHLGALAGAAVLSALKTLPPYAFLAFIPVTIKALRPAASPGFAAPPIKRIGYAELAHAVVFSTLTLLIL